MVGDGSLLTPSFYLIHVIKIRKDLRIGLNTYKEIIQIKRCKNKSPADVQDESTHFIM
jgi:hypothetical protein